jgi:hypothetical protein
MHACTRVFGLRTTVVFRHVLWVFVLFAAAGIGRHAALEIAKMGYIVLAGYAFVLNCSVPFTL